MIAPTSGVSDGGGESTGVLVLALGVVAAAAAAVVAVAVAAAAAVAVVVVAGSGVSHTKALSSTGRDGGGAPAEEPVVLSPEVAAAGAGSPELNQRTRTRALSGCSAASTSRVRTG